MAKHIAIVERASGKVEKTIDASNMGERAIQRTMDGMEINLNHADYKVELREGPVPQA